MKKYLAILFCLITFFSVFAATDSSASGNVSLLKTAKEMGITVFWDSLSESGLLEKNGHQMTFRKNDGIILLDNLRVMMTDPPVIKNNELYVTDRFIEDATAFFTEEDDEDLFKVGAILIDAGHGGKDPGALKTYDVGGKKVTIQEKDINLKVAKMLYERLKTAYPEKQIILTRSTDVFLSLSERTDIANAVKVPDNDAILFISIHVNSSLNKSSSGYEVWYLSPGYRRTVLDKTAVDDDKSLFPILNSMMEEEYTTESIMIARFIMDGLQAQIGNQSKARGIKAEEWFVVKNANMPSVLIELGFVSNQEEAMLLNSDTYLKKATLGIYNGISAFITHFERSKGFTSANE
ncbi:MAG: N-acetylmuramoyl-L-alanine amidase [Lachnospiraceae bacterium]|nr:N-acetylmuramoyl-L-alanine amidase [Lachnospiraceae bacterium]